MNNDLCGKNLKGIDVTKLICAILVIIIHTDPFSQWFLLDKTFGVLDKVAVPFFFIASGFFLFQKMNSSDIQWRQKRFIMWVKRLVIMYVLWFIIYLPHYLRVNGLPDNILTVLQVLFVSGTSSHLWFLPALIFAATAVCLMSKIISPNKILIIGLILIVAGTVIKTYGPVTPILCDMPITKFASEHDDVFFMNGLVYGIFYLALGLKFANNDVISWGYFEPFILISCFVIFAAEGFFATEILHTPSTANYIMAIPTSYMLYSFVYKLNVSISEKASLFMRKLSSLSYNLHFGFIYILELVGWKPTSLRMFIIDTALTLMFSAIIIQLTNKFRVLKYFY